MRWTVSRSKIICLHIVDHVGDCALPSEPFQFQPGGTRLNSPGDLANFQSSVQEPICLSLLGAIMLRTGWAYPNEPELQRRVPRLERQSSPQFPGPTSSTHGKYTAANLLSGGVVTEVGILILLPRADNCEPVFVLAIE